MTPKKKLIEVALPLDAINKACAREKSIRHGHPSTLHLWWARRPLAAARAVIFAQMVDDPSSHPERFPTDEAQEKERQRLFRLIEQLVMWENISNERVLGEARMEIWKSWRSTCAENQKHPRAKQLFDPEKLPGFHDPFAGGGTLPLEAQRLGLESYASDLNPVSVLITKAMIEIPPKFAGLPPVNPTAHKDKALIEREWRGAQGLAEDVRYYGRWMREEAEKRIGYLYPKVEITAEMAKDRPDLKPYVGKKLTVMASLWARTVKSPNPAFARVDVPLASTFVLSKMKGNEAYVELVTEGGGYRFTVKVGKPKNAEVAEAGTKAGKKGGFRCVMSDVPIPYEYIRAEASAERMSDRLMAIVAEGERGRVYLPPSEEFEAVARKAKPSWLPNTETHGKCRVNIGLYGMTSWDKLFTPRQLLAVTTFSDLVQEARERAKVDARVNGLPDSGKGLDAGATGATAYADAVAVYLALVVSSLSDRMSTICTWDAGGATWGTKTRNTFARQAIPMSWDFAEVNPLSTQSGSFENSLDYTSKGISISGEHSGSATQGDATTQETSRGKVVSTDPPYYDNIGYADLSDYFYIWLRRSLKPVFPDLFSTMAVPKAEELVATPYRHGTKEKAEAFFMGGMTKAMHRLAEQAHPAFPVTIYYAFKQSESDGADGTASTGWDTFLDAVIRAGFAISGTWPMRTELSNRMIGSGANALASSIVLVCRPRATDVLTATRRDFVSALKAELPVALAHLQRGNIAPVDLAQAAIGPGMAVFTRYAKVLDAEGKPLSVREALALINQTLDEALAEQEGDFDADSRWAVAWFEQSGFAEGEYGVAETLSKAKNTSVSGMVAAGILASKGGKVRLLRPNELPVNWDPETDPRLTAWESVHHLVRALEAGGENAAAELVAKLGAQAEIARELAYRLYTVCERKKRAQEALSYNALVQSWPEITRLAREGARTPAAQTQLFSEG
jgi:putative DNA methylase